MKDLVVETIILSQPSDTKPVAARPEMAAVKHGIKSPTCKVCGDESSGFHYGVDSCEGCKGFFRRCITQGMTHKCSNEERCEITPFTRNSCQYCRLKKCFSVGMSREASRLGRRPKRLKDSKEDKSQGPSGNLPIAPYPSPSELYKLRMAELQRLLQQNGTFKSELMQAFLSAAQASFKEHQRNTPANQNNDNEKVAQVGSESGYSSFSSPESSKSQSPVDASSDLNNTEKTMNELNENNNQVVMLDNKNSVTIESKDILSNQNQMYITNMSNIDSPQNLMNSQNMNGTIMIKSEPNSSLTPCNMTASSMAQMVDNAASLNMSASFPERPSAPVQMASDEDCMPPCAPEGCIDIDRVHEEVRQIPTELRQNLIEQVIETVSAAHMETCNPTYENVAKAEERFQQMASAGMLPDLKNLSIDPSDMWRQFMTNMVPEITLAVKFCKKIPGFGEITQDDQILLIKQGSFEVLVTRFCNLVDHVKGTMWDSEMKMKCPKHVIQNMPMGPFVMEFFRVASMFNPLQLTNEEIGLFTSVLLISPDRMNLKNKKAIQKLQSLLMQSLYFLMKENHDGYDELFVRTLNTIHVFKEINAKHAMALNNMKMNTGLKFPPLHEEVFDGHL